MLRSQENRLTSCLLFVSRHATTANVDHASRNATMGSIRVARRAGT